MTAIFHVARTPDGRLLEYRATPLAVATLAVHRAVYLPKFLRDWVARRGVIQRRIDGGRWTTIGKAGVQ